ncbi:transglutaminase [Pseudalgibacter alginicilyticus]|uniref:Transglutaminase n=1 Tax=Pseudalgibacter alginicilyticus TaxID=1736674 RepID=A0A0P0CKJ2_9FLAO|nr:transglutaminase domain-containing protein [Pseudalgibacter alginicilyticus]ALJ04937.1 transglutaminase [Pseudalgibacter alginicilyticus]
MKQYSIILFFVFSFLANAQDYRFGKVSEDELQETFNPLDSSASATYLYKYRKTYFRYDHDEGFQLITDVHQRLKIYNQEGFNYATKEINLYKSGSNEEIFGYLKANTYNLIDGKIEDEKLDKDGVFKTERSKYYNQVKFTMPNIKEGCIVEFKYQIESPFYSLVDDYEFQNDIPIKKLEAEFEVPEFFKFKLNTKGFLPITPKTESKNDKIIFTNKTRGSASLYGGVQETSYQTNNLDFTKSITYYELTDVPALKDEPYVNNIDNYRSSVKYELSYTEFPNAIPKYYATTWEDVVKKIYESSNFGLELERTGYFEDDIDVLIGSISDPATRAAIIYNFVKTKVKWNKYYGYYTDEGVRKAYKDQVGNVAEINLMLTAMLRYAGLDANPVLVSTRHHGIPLFPTLDGYNYVISGIETPEGTVLLDATNKYSLPNILPFRALNWEGRIIRSNGSSAAVNLYPNQKSASTIIMMVTLAADGLLEGSIRTIKNDHSAMFYREQYNESNKEQFLEKLENKYNGIEISDFTVANESDLLKPIMETYKFSLENQADVIGDKIYFSPLFFLRTKSNPFKLEFREFPVDFGYPQSSVYRISINLPQGYNVESLPDSKAFTLPDNMGTFTYQVVNVVGGLQLTVNEQINSSIISSQYYTALKEYFKQIIEKQNEQIVLTKA